MRYKMTVRDFCNLLEQESILTESKSGYSRGISFRLDNPNGYLGQQVHVHVDQKNLHYAWNKDGSRSHRGSWPQKEPSNAIKQIAAEKLGIDMNLLESVMDYMLVSDDVEDDDLEQLLESVGIGQ